jgi:hypothetical protein
VESQRWTEYVPAPFSVVQRTGYLLDHVGAKDNRAARAVARNETPAAGPLACGQGPAAGEADARWAILANEKIEVEE